MQLQKKFNQKSPAVKKVCGPEKAVVKEDVKPRVVAKRWLLMIG